jgi:hypothetical protein
MPIINIVINTFTYFYDIKHDKLDRFTTSNYIMECKIRIL